MIAVVDYNAGNLGSVKKALDYIGAQSTVTSSAREIERADGVIFPGVGSFGEAVASLRSAGLFSAVKEAASGQKPFLGICLGLQMLFAHSDESPQAEGLGVLEGEIRRIPSSTGLKVPHMGWNSLHIVKKDGIFRDIPEDSYVYFVHSYYLQARSPQQVAARTEYGVSIDAAVSDGLLFATQFHPEKSGEVGLQILRNFYELVRGGN